MYPRLSLLLLGALRFALADVSVTSPAAGATVPAGQLTIKYVEGSGQTPIADLVSMQVFLVAGGNQDSDSYTITSQATAAALQGGQTTLTIPAAAGPATNAVNAYYLKIQSTSKSGTVINYSNRFSISGMTGAWSSPQFQQAAAQFATTPNVIPAAVDQGSANNAAAAPAAGSTIPFAQQTGGIKYAPMQKKPGTSITQTNTAPLYPTSAWSVFTTIAPLPSQTSTQTPSGTFSASSRENTAAPVAQPTNDMQKFLARWRD